MFEQAGGNKAGRMRKPTKEPLKIFSVILIVFGVVTSLCCDLFYGYSDGMIGGLLFAILGGQFLLYSKKP
jgi:hypothetical protein